MANTGRILALAALAAVSTAAAGTSIVILHYDHLLPGDLVAFDWFELTGQTDALTPPPNGAPEPGTLWLTAAAVALLVPRRRRIR